ncbi:MAG TPA: MBL fold metallo-hydrolase [Acidimicrobiia bacterium]|nr:MBL fold metallo-hydrolase [Acidimicrobiia bacterium]
MTGGARVTFHGVRGSTPCDGPQLARYGGNTSCVAIEADEHEPIVLDLGTGLRAYGNAIADAGNAAGFHASVLLTHLHWDHVQGLPFFAPLQCPESALDVFGPRQDGGRLAEVFAGVMCPPYFPIRPDELVGQVSFTDTGDDDFPVGSAKVRSRWVRHVGPTLGFRVEIGGVSVAYISDHGQGCGGGSTVEGDEYVPQEVLELADGADLLIHDSQHTPTEFVDKRHYGHCTIEYAVHVAREAGARQLALFHHDPSHSDAQVDQLVHGAQEIAASVGSTTVFGASEGLVVPLAPAHAR